MCGPGSQTWTQSPNVFQGPAESFEHPLDGGVLAVMEGEGLLVGFFVSLFFFASAAEIVLK